MSTAAEILSHKQYRWAGSKDGATNRQRVSSAAASCFCLTSNTCRAVSTASAVKCVVEAVYSSLLCGNMADASQSLACIVAVLCSCTSPMSVGPHDASDRLLLFAVSKAC